MTTLTTFPTTVFLTPHRYKRNLRPRLLFSWSYIFTRCHIGVEVSIMGSSEATALKEVPDDAIKYGVKSNKWHGHKDHVLVFFYCAKAVVESSCYENQSVFFSQVSGGKEKNLLKKCSFLTFWKHVTECRTFPRRYAKNNCIFRNTWKISSIGLIFAFLSEAIFRV